MALQQHRRKPSSASPADAAAVPVAYRLFFLYIEPFSALVGAFYAHVLPRAYLALTHASSAPARNIPTGTGVVLTQLANLYLLFALNEALVLRSTSDIRLWKTLLAGLLIADLGHLYSVSPLGPDVYYKVTTWNAMAWGNVGFVYCGALMRIAFLSGFGLTRPVQKSGKGA